MKEWIKELEDNFKFKNHDKGDLVRYNLDGRTNLHYQMPNESIYLDGQFTIKQLEALINHMKKYNA